MATFIVRRLMATVTVLFLLSLAVFFLLRVMPGDDVFCPSFCSIEHREALRHEYELDKPLFPVSVEADASNLWLLVVPAAGLAGYASWRAARRRRDPGVMDYALPRLAWNLAAMSLLTISLVAPFEWRSRTGVILPQEQKITDAFRVWHEHASAFVHPNVPIPNRLAEEGMSLLILPAAALAAFVMVSLLTRPRMSAIPRAD